MPFVNASSAATGAGSDLVPSANLGGKLRVAHAVYNYATDAQGVYTIPIRVPRSAVVMEVAFNTSVSTGSATVAIGIAGAPAKYRAAAAITTTDTWVTTGAATPGTLLNAVAGVPLAAEEQLIMTTAAATMPASGRGVVRVTWVDNS